MNIIDSSGSLELFAGGPNADNFSSPLSLQETPMASQSKPQMKRDAILASIRKHRFDLPSDYHFNRDDLYEGLQAP